MACSGEGIPTGGRRGSLVREIDNRISPPLQCTLDIHETGGQGPGRDGKKILRVLVPRGDDPPYAVDDNKIYVRDEAETGLAVRDEIVGLVLRGKQQQQPAATWAMSATVQPAVTVPETSEPAKVDVPVAAADEAPRTGVEIVAVDEREGGRYYTMRDLRNGMVVKNVTRTSARRLWHYAITEYNKLPSDLTHGDIHWMGNLGLIRCHQQGKCERYDLLQRTPQGIRYFFGVTDDGIHGPWKALVGVEEE